MKAEKYVFTFYSKNMLTKHTVPKKIMNFKIKVLYLFLFFFDIFPIRRI